MSLEDFGGEGSLGRAEGSMGLESACSSLAELRAEHLALLRSWRRSEGADGSLIIAFRRRIAATGALLGEEADRETAQDFLDYWDAQLLSIANGEGIRQAELPLAPYAGIPTAGAEPEPELPQELSKAMQATNSEASEQLRLSALARQWRQSHGVQSYLLTGAALNRAAIFRHKDPEIEAFVAASEHRDVRRRRRRNRYIVSGVATAVLVIASGVAAALLYAQMMAQTAQKTVEDELGQARSVSNTYLNRLQRVTNTLIEAGPDRSADGLLRLTYLIDNSVDARGPWIVENLKRGLAPFAATPAAQARATDSLVGNLMHFSVDGLSVAGRDNLLQVLASISVGQWSGTAIDEADKAGWLDTRAGARRAAAFLDYGPKPVELTEDARTEFARLRGNIALDPAPKQDVVLRLGDAVRDRSGDVITGVLRLGWTLSFSEGDGLPAMVKLRPHVTDPDQSKVMALMNQDIEAAIRQYSDKAPAAAPSPPTVNEVVYGAPADRDAALMLAADLAKCGYAMGSTRAEAAIPAGRLEARLATPSQQSCIPPGLTQPGAAAAQ